ncbi:MAG: hypothetical protein N3D74_00990 [Caldisericia bacterium]|nr:hypothetical protein [Caldisericia bacterium]
MEEIKIKDKDFLGSQGKLIDILEYIFLKDEIFVDINEISNLFKLSKSGSYRILSVLLKKGFLDHKKGDSKFYLNNKIFELSKKILFKELIYFLGEKMVSELGEKLKEDVFLFKLENGDLKLVYSNSKKSNYQFFPIHSTSFGKVIVSFLNKEEAIKLLENLNLETFTNFTKINLKDLFEEFKKIKKEGFSISIEEFAYGFFDISVPIFDINKNSIYSLGTIISKTKLSEFYIKEIIKSLKETKRKIEKDLSYFYKFQ